MSVLCLNTTCWTSSVCTAVCSPVWGQLGLPLGNFMCQYTAVITQKWINLKFLIFSLTSLPTCSLEILKLLRFLLRISLTSIHACNDQQMCKHFCGHCQLILRATQWTVLSLSSMKNKKTNPTPNKNPLSPSGYVLWALSHSCHMAWPACRVWPSSSPRLGFPPGPCRCAPEQSSASSLECYSSTLYFFCSVFILIVV